MTDTKQTFDFKEVDGQVAMTIVDVKQALNQLVFNFNTLSEKLKDRNIQRADKQKAKDAQVECVKQMLDITVAGITAGMLETDDLGVLRADVNEKTFKGNVGHVNSILKKYIEEKKEQDLDKKLSDVELAKLMESPYSYTDPSEAHDIDPARFNDKGVAELRPDETIPEPNGDDVIKLETNDPKDDITIDKSAGLAYVKKGDKTFVKSLRDKGYVWYEVGKAIAISVFGFVWNLVLAVSKRVINYIWTLVCNTTTLGINVVKDTGVEGTTFWGKVVNAKNNAVAKIKAKEKEQESNPAQALEAPKSVVLPAENTELDLVGVPA